MGTNRYLLVCLGAAATLVGAVMFFVSGLVRPSASDPNENLLAAFEAWARCGNG
jgi:hypothetical protein